MKTWIIRRFEPRITAEQAANVHLGRYLVSWLRARVLRVLAGKSTVVMNATIHGTVDVSGEGRPPSLCGVRVEGG